MPQCSFVRLHGIPNQADIPKGQAKRHSLNSATLRLTTTNLPSSPSEFHLDERDSLSMILYTDHD
ncbi:hypothetical protein CFAM422_010630 [Trichoderma lentiforme]|uniref:Uncharacterized protein n=1 Tax=Trichoderma lentiforme TaxID=1567552 RepID=A0A9P4X8B7_9HYPO|nr:hypothetical protein CFAM422_010630 [Trichoderma lentiforme]